MVLHKSRNLFQFVSVLLSASVKRVGVSRMRDFFCYVLPSRTVPRPKTIIYTFKNVLDSVCRNSFLPEFTKQWSSFHNGKLLGQVFLMKMIQLRIFCKLLISYPLNLQTKPNPVAGNISQCMFCRDKECQ